MNKIYLDQERYYEPINRICTKYRIPYVYDWTMSLHTNMDYLIKLMNGMVIEYGLLQDMIEEFIRMFDKDLQETIIKTLEKWQEEGKLEGIINEALFNQKLDKEEFINYKQDQMKLDVSQNVAISELSEELNNKIRDINIDLLNFVTENVILDSLSIQGIQTVNNGYVVSLTGTKTKLQHYTDNHVLIKEKDLLLGHANTVAYDGDNTLYVPHSSNSGGSYKDIHVVRLDTFEKVKTINSNVNISSLSYSEGFFYAISEKILYIGSELTEMKKISLLDLVGVPQGMSIRNNLIYVLSSLPETIQVFNSEGNKVRTYNINEFTNDLYYINEIEDISFEGSDVYISVNSNVNTNRAVKNNMVIRSNILTNEGGGKINYSDYPNSTVEIFVDKKGSINSTGLLASDPISRLDLALAKCVNPKYRYTIKIGEGEWKEKHSLSMSSTNIEIVGVKDKTIIHDLQLIRLDQVWLTNLTIKSELSYPVLLSFTKESYIKNCKLISTHNQFNLNIYGGKHVLESTVFESTGSSDVQCYYAQVQEIACTITKPFKLSSGSFLVFSSDIQSNINSAGGVAVKTGKVM